MIQRMQINIDPSDYKSVSLWEPEKEAGISFINFVEDIYYTILQNNNSLVTLLQDYRNKNQEIMNLQEKIQSLESTIQILESKIIALEIANKEK